MVQFASIMSIIVIAITIPLIALYACGKFVGQRTPTTLVKNVVMVGVGAGLLFGVWFAFVFLNSRGMTYGEWMLAAWIAGSALSGQVALLEALNQKPEA